MATDRYVRPDWFTRSIFTPLVAWFTARGREPRRRITPWLADRTYPCDRDRGCRQAPGATRLPQEMVLESRREGVGASASEADLQRISPNHPIFRIEA